MQYTSNYNLKKPEGTDIVNIDDLNYNADILDQKLKELENGVYNAPPNSVNDLAIGTLTPDQTQVPTSPGSGTLSQILSWLANRIKTITGKTNWWDAPPTTLQAVKMHMDAAAPHSGHETPAGAQAKAEAAAGAVQAELNTHLAKKVHQGEVHGLRLTDGKLKFFDGSNWVEIKTGGGVPIGSVIPWTTTTIPDGWLECNGQAVSRTDFSELFAKIGTTFGSGDGSTTFNVPDLRGEFIRGWDNGRGVDPSRTLGSAQTDAGRNITGSMRAGGNANNQFIDSLQCEGAFAVIPGNKSYTNETGGSGQAEGASFDASRVWGAEHTASEFRPRNVALIFIIKAKDVVGSDPTVQGANADTLDGFHASAFALSGHIHTDPSTIKPALNAALNASGDAPIYACRAWVNFDGTTSPPTIRASGNVSSVTRNGTGDYTVNFAIPMPHANYSATANYTKTNTAQGKENDGQAIPWNYQANFVRIFISDGSAYVHDGKIVSVSIHC